jgi:hypothetical protein
VRIILRLTNAIHIRTRCFATVDIRFNQLWKRYEILGIVDIVVTMNWIDFGDGKPTRAFVCTSPNPWGYPAKDRSGKLDQLEPPDLGALIKKILPARANHGAAAAAPPSQPSIIPFNKQQEE